MDATQTVMPMEGIKRRLGLVPARIGAELAHKLGIPIPLEPARYKTSIEVPGPVARTRVAKKSPTLEMGAHPGHAVPIPVRALPGHTMYLPVQDLTSLEPELAAHVKWICRHPNCAGQKWNSKGDLRVEHGDHKRLRDESEREPGGGQPHLFYAVLEIAGTAGSPERKNDKGQITHEAIPATQPTVMLLSDEE